MLLGVFLLPAYRLSSHCYSRPGAGHGTDRLDLTVRSTSSSRKRRWCSNGALSAPDPDALAAVGLAASIAIPDGAGQLPAPGRSACPVRWTRTRLALLATGGLARAVHRLGAGHRLSLKAGPYGVIALVGPWYFVGLALLVITIVVAARHA